MSSCQEVISALGKYDEIAVVCHVNPDGDCVGSMLGMGLILQAMGKKVTFISSDVIPGAYSFLPGSQHIKGVDNLGGQQAVVFVDCTDPDRAGEQVARSVSGIPCIINIDHHVSNRQFGHLNLVDPEAAATGEIIYRLAKEIPLPLTKEIALCLYTAIVMDTGSFRYENTTGTTHRIAAELVDTGLNVFDINRNLYEDVPLTNLKVIQLGLAGLKTSSCGRVAWITLREEDMRKIDAGDEHIDGLINYTRMIKGVEVGILFRETGEGLIKISFRSKDRVDVNRLAGEFGGGGHPRASGCRIATSLAQAEEQVVAAASRLLEGC
ncbi:MAG: bifunctional oligoribonuclease/PAP phosphatase NrnA [Clostridia bacterium]|nr:bifunctional oligoribonuclease/PAP phosphatase NrnA [Clostridia bacterium]